MEKKKPITNYLNYSITGNGTVSCSGSCVYCSAATTLNYTMGIGQNNTKEEAIKALKEIDEKTYNVEYKADYNKLAETIEHNSRFKRAKEIQEKQGVQCNVSIDFWSADPVTCHLIAQDVYAFCKDFFVNKHGMKFQFSSSTNGLPLTRDDIRDWYLETDSKLQISHDGCGQWMRTKDIDPLYDDRMSGNIAELFNNGNLALVNDCLNFYNGDVFANKKYWDDYFNYIKLPADKRMKLYVKLNRIYDGDYNIQKLNQFGIFGSDKRVWEELKNKPFGNMNHHNWKNANTGNTELDHLLAHELDNYMNDWLRLAILVRDPDVKKSLSWKPYISYISEQVNRWRPMKDRNDSFGSCRRYQRAVNGLGDPAFWGKPNEDGVYENFVIDTTGKYCECNLIDGDHKTKNPGGFIEPEACKKCRYYLQAECMGCGSEEINPDCEWRYRWVAMLEQVKLLDALLAKGNPQKEKEMYQKGMMAMKQQIGMNIVDKYLINNKGNCNCNGSGNTTPKR